MKNITTDFSSNETEYRISEVLQMVAHAGNCVLYQDRKGVVRIEPWKNTYSNYVVNEDISYSYPEYAMNKPLKKVSVGYGSNNQTVDVEYASTGEVQTVNNPLIVTPEAAVKVGEKTVNILSNRKTITGEYRADLRLDALDNIMVSSKYATNVIGVTSVEYNLTGGSFRGKYTGRVVSIALDSAKAYSNEFYSNEIW